MSWITSCQFRDAKIAGVIRGIELLCVPITLGAYPYNTQVSEIQIDFVQQWMNSSKEAVYIDGAGQNKIEFFAWDYSGYQIKPGYAVVTKGADGRDNYISGNMELKHISFASPQNAYNSRYRTYEYKSVLHRRICAIKHIGGGSFEIERGYHIPVGVNGVNIDPNDSYALILNYIPGFDAYQRPYVICQDTNNTKGYSLRPFYNQSAASIGEVRFYIIKNNGNDVANLSEVPIGAIFIVEIICI